MNWSYPGDAGGRGLADFVFSFFVVGVTGISNAVVFTLSWLYIFSSSSKSLELQKMCS